MYRFAVRRAPPMRDVARNVDDVAGGEIMDLVTRPEAKLAFDYVQQLIKGVGVTWGQTVLVDDVLECVPGQPDEREIRLIHDDARPLVLAADPRLAGQI